MRKSFIIPEGRQSLCCALLAFMAFLYACGCQESQSVSFVSDFTLPEVRGGVFHLRAERSPAILLAFLQTLPDTADTLSRRQAAFLLSMQRQYGERCLRVAIIDSSALISHVAPKNDAVLNASYDWHLSVPLLEDDANRVAMSAGVKQVPTLLLLGPDGSIFQRWNGLTGPASLALGIEKLCGGHHLIREQTAYWPAQN